MIISGGENIYPREVEEVLYQHPSVSEAAIIGVPDPYWVERVHAVITLKVGTACSSDEIIDFCKQRIARYKAPKSIEFLDTLPKNPSGKILKTELRKLFKILGRYALCDLVNCCVQNHFNVHIVEFCIPTL